MPSLEMSAQRNGPDQALLHVMSREHPIENQLQIIINKHPHLKQKHFRLNAKEGRVTMQGTVKSWYEKQMAQEALRNIDGVNRIDNELTVESV